MTLMTRDTHDTFKKIKNILYFLSRKFVDVNFFLYLCSVIEH